MSVVDFVVELTGLDLEEESKKSLLAILQKLPSLDDLRRSASQDIDEASESSLPDQEVSRQNPSFEENIEVDSKIAAEILARFEKVYEKTTKTGIVAIDEIKKQAVYLRFIAQECAERSAAGVPLYGDFHLKIGEFFHKQFFTILEII